MVNYTKNHLGLGDLPRQSGRTRAAEHNSTATSAKRWPLACLVVLAAIVAHVEAAMNLPDGIENILGFVPRSSFQCERDGYFGDIDNDCRLFHLCQRQVGANGRVEWRHWTYACGNQTMFNQLTLTCAFVDEAIPCRHASQFQYLNEVIHKPAEPFLTDADVTSGFSYYSNRVMSDGARQRAFQDSQLLAQIGGQGAQANSQQQQAATSNSPTFAQQQSPSLDDQFRQQASFAVRLPDHNHHRQQRQLVAASLPQQQQPNIQNQVNLIENHSFQLQHQQEGPFQSQAQFQPQFQSQFQPVDNNSNNDNNFALFQQQQPRQTAGIASASSSQRQAFSAPLPTTTTTTTSTTTQAQNLNSQDNSINLQGQQSPAQQQNSQFEFSITTNHQANAPSEPATVLVKQQQPFEFKFGPPQTQSPPQVPTTTTTTESSSLLSNNWTVQPTQQSGGAATSTVSSATLVPTFTSSQRLQLAQPTQATVALQSQPQTTTESSTTTTSNTLPTTVGSPQASTITRAPEVTSRQARRLVSASSQAGRRGEQVGIERAHVGFQSTRLSSQKKRQAAASETPIVMRKNPKPDGSPSPTNFNKFRADLGSSMGSSSPASLAPIAAGAQVPWLTGGDFWRRSFDSQLMAPKFESLLLRNRV